MQDKGDGISTKTLQRPISNAGIGRSKVQSNYMVLLHIRANDCLFLGFRVFTVSSCFESHIPWVTCKPEILMVVVVPVPFPRKL